MQSTIDPNAQYVRSSRDLPAISTSVVTPEEVEIFSVIIHREHNTPSPDGMELKHHYNGMFLFFDLLSNGYTFYVENERLEEPNFINSADIVALLRQFNSFCGMYFLLLG